MRAWIYVEGPSDKLGLDALWTQWCGRMRAAGRGITIIPLMNKANFLKKVGQRAAEKLAANDSDVVVGLPDLYPTAPFARTSWAHSDAAALKAVQLRQVRAALTETQRLSAKRADAALTRFFPSLFKYDFEMLLLAAEDALRATLGTAERLGGWRVPVEEQNLDRPPKRIIEELFVTKSSTRTRYRDTRHAPATLRRVADLSQILRTSDGRSTCPEFVDMLRWLGERLGSPCCELP